MNTSECTAYHLFIARIDGQDYKVPHVMGDAEFEEIIQLNNGYLPQGLRVYHFNNMDHLMLNPIIAAMPVYKIPVKNLFGTMPAQPMKLKDKQREKTFDIRRKYGDFVLCEGSLMDVFRQVDGVHSCIITKLKVCPITLREAQEYIKKHHRHCSPPKFHKFSVALKVDGEQDFVGVGVASTPKARAQMDGETLEINRVCSDARYADVCSKLYALMIRAGKSMGYRRFISYTLPEEDGASLKAAGFHLDGITEGRTSSWSSGKRPRNIEKYPQGAKFRWVLFKGGD